MRDPVLTPEQAAAARRAAAAAREAEHAAAQERRLRMQQARSSLFCWVPLSGSPLQTGALLYTSKAIRSML
jgi:hypothetical protein